MGRINEVKRAVQLRKWAEQYKMYQDSGKTVSEWCQDSELSPATFYYRLKKLREAALDSAESKEISISDSSECHEIVSVGDFKQTGDNIGQSIKITSGNISVELPADISPEMIKVVIEGLRQC